MISVGENNYGHPRPEALSAYEAVAQWVYRTDVVGQVTVFGAEDGRYAVLAGQDSLASGRERAGVNPCRAASNE